MTNCKQCQRYFSTHLREWIRFKGPFGYKVTDRIGKHSYKCVCNRCGFAWNTRSNDAAFQFNDPIAYQQHRERIGKFYEKLLQERERGYTVHIHPIQIQFGDEA